MLSLFDRRPGHSRREFLRIGTLGLGGLALPHLLAANALAAGKKPISTGKSVIFLFQFGGPSQLETFDPKMNAPDSTRTVTGEIATAIPGVTFGSSLPELAKRANKLAVVRSYNAGGRSCHDVNPIVCKETLGCNLGAFHSRMVGMINPANGVPTNAALFPQAIDPKSPPVRMDFGNFLSTGPLGMALAPFAPGGSSTLQENMRLNIERDRLDDRRRLLAQLDGVKRQFDASGIMDGMDRIQSQAVEVILRGASTAFDLTQESPETVARYDTAPLLRASDITGKWADSNYFEHAKTLGKQLLLARRLCESGCGFVMVNSGFVWDMHGVPGVHAGVEQGMRYTAPPFDHAVSAFLDDVEARGLSDKILLVMCGEMGRAPKISEVGGRGHWGRLGPLVLAGGGLPMGQVIGRSTSDGGEIADNPVQMRNLIGTIFHTLFDVAELRLGPDATGPVAKVITESEPIRQLTG